jgi:hypothetical protein
MRTSNTFILATLCAALLLPSFSRAQATGALFSAPAVEDEEESSGRGGALSPLVLALAATAGPIAAGAALSPYNEGISGLLIFSGMFIGPSVGQFYAGSIGHGWAGIGIRGAGAAIGAVGFVMALSDAFCGLDNGECSDKHGATPAILFFGGGLTYVGGVLFSLIDSPLRLAENEGPERKFGFAPALLPDSRGGWAKGASAWMRF